MGREFGGGLETTRETKGRYHINIEETADEQWEVSVIGTGSDIDRNTLTFPDKATAQLVYEKAKELGELTESPEALMNQLREYERTLPSEQAEE